MGLGKGGELTQGADTQPVEQLGQFGTVENVHRQGGQEGGGPAHRDDEVAAGGEDGGEQPVGHTDLDRGDAGGGVGDPLDQCAFAPEVAGRPAGRERADTGPHGGDPRAEGLGGFDHLDERPEGGPTLVIGEEVGAAHDEEAVHAGTTGSSAASATAPVGGGQPQVTVTGTRRRPTTRGRHRHPAPAQVPLAGTHAVPPRVADLQLHIGVLGPSVPSRHHQHRPALPGPGHQSAGHGRAGRERGAEHHEIDAVDQRRGDLGPGGTGPGDQGQP